MKTETGKDLFVGELTYHSLHEADGLFGIGDTLHDFIDVHNNLAHEDGKAGQRAKYICEAVNMRLRGETEITSLLEQVEQLKALNRFLCATWVSIDKWAHNEMDASSLGSYPQIQGTRNQLNLIKISEQDFDKSLLGKAVKLMLESE